MGCEVGIIRCYLEEKEVVGEEYAAAEAVVLEEGGWYMVVE